MLLEKPIDELSSGQDWQRQRLDNGLRAIHAPLGNDSRLYLGLIVRAGSRYEQRQQGGVSHFLEHMMFRGSKDYPSFAALADAFEWLGGEWNAATSQEYTEYSYQGPCQSLSKALELFANFIQHPLLLDLEKERQVILREIEDELNEYGHSTDLSWHMAALMWPASSLAQPIAGTLASVKSIHLADLQNFRQTHYRPSQMSLCVVGGKQNTPVLAEIQQAFASYRLLDAKTPCPDHSREQPFRGPACKWVPHSDNQYHVQISFQTEGEWSTKAATYELINYILVDGFSARLPYRLREQLGLVYDVEAHLSLFSDRGTFDISAAVTAQNLSTFISETCQLLARFAEEGPSEKELAKAKLRAGADLELLPYRPSSLGFRLAWHSLCHKEVSLAQEKTQLESISMDAIKAVSRELFNAQNCGLVLLGPKQKELEAKILKLLSKFLA